MMELPKLQKGDVIAVIAPAGSVAQKDIEIGIAYLQKQGWKVEYGKNTFQRHQFGYSYAGTEAQRANDLQWAIDHPTAKAIWCARGGYGCVQIIDSVDFTTFLKQPKWIIGYSDNTVLHQFLSVHSVPSIHGLVLKPLPQNHTKSSYDSIKKILQHKELSYTIKPHKYNTVGRISGAISGGNLSIIYSLLQSKTIDAFYNKILFIEDWYENQYHLDRMLMALERAGIFQNLKGIIVGGFTKMDDISNKNYEKPFDALSYEIIRFRLKKYNFPKVFGFPAGHIKDNRALLFGVETTIEVTEQSVRISFS